MKALTKNEIEIMQRLPEVFTRAQVISVLSELGLHDRTWDIFTRRKLFDKYFIRTKGGTYMKINYKCPKCGESLITRLGES